MSGDANYLTITEYTDFSTGDDISIRPPRLAVKGKSGIFAAAIIASFEAGDPIPSSPVKSATKGFG